MLTRRCSLGWNADSRVWADARRLLALLFLTPGCTPPVTFFEASPAWNSSISKNVAISPDGRERLSSARSVAITLFDCEDARVASAVRNVIAASLLSSGIAVKAESSEADVTIQGTITFSEDYYGSGAAYGSGSVTGAAAQGGSGKYVSGIIANIAVNGTVTASVSATQVRTPRWIPDPPEILARWVGVTISDVFRESRTR